MKLIAECCNNHMGDRKIMQKMIRTLAQAGVDVCKFQSYRADRLNPSWPDYEKSLEYYKKHELSEEDHMFLTEECHKQGIEFLTTVFSSDLISSLTKLGIKRVKIASPDCNNWSLIAECLQHFDHIIISTGMHSPAEINALADFLKNDLNRVTVMHCVSLYPCPEDKINLLRIGSLMKLFPSVGFSDHTLGTDAAKVAMCLGVACVEKHFTLDRSLPGKDQAMSATTDDFKELVQWRDKVRTMMYYPEFADLEARRYIERWI